MIKKWVQFIKETYVNHSPETKSMYPIDEDDISDYLLDMTESGHWLVSVNFGFLKDDNTYTEKISSYTAQPAISIEIGPYDKTTNVDFTSTVTSFIKRVSVVCKEIRLYDIITPVDIKDLKFKGSIFISDSPK